MVDVCKYKDESEVESEPIKVGGFRRGYDEKRPPGAGAFGHMTGRDVCGGPAGRKELADRCSLTMSLSGASASAAAKQRHQEQLRADTSALVDAARGQRQMPELPPYVPEFDLAFMSQMLGVGAVRSEPEDPATGDDETIMQEAAVDIALQLLTDGEGLQALLASDEPSADRVALEGADNALANSRARVDQLYELVR